MSTKIVAALTLRGAVVSSEDGFNWNACCIDDPTGSKYKFHAIKWIAPNFYAIGSKNAIFRSRDAVNWVKCNNIDKSSGFPFSNEEANLLSIAASPDGSRIVVVGEWGSIFWSEDSGETWKFCEDLQTLATFFDVQSLENGQVFVAVGDIGRIAKSIDGGKTWKLLDYNDYGSVFVSLAVSSPHAVVV